MLSEQELDSICQLSLDAAQVWVNQPLFYGFIRPNTVPAFFWLPGRNLGSGL